VAPFVIVSVHRIRDRRPRGHVVARAIGQVEPRRLAGLQLPHRAGDAEPGGVHGELGAGAPPATVALGRYRLDDETPHADGVAGAGLDEVAVTQPPECRSRAPTT